jgi:hypothetical protein
MMHSIHRETLVDTLLNSLAAERYMRGALLFTLIDELAGQAGLEVAVEAAEAMLADVATLSDDALAQRIDTLRHLVRTLSAPESGVRVKESLARGSVPAVPSAASAA